MSETDLGARPATATPDDGDAPSAPWWHRTDLRHRGGRLHLGRTDLDALARKVGTPTYVLRAPRVREKAEQIHAALDRAGLAHRLHYAIKANRSPQLLAYLARERLCGADICSPEELLHALSCGFREEDISFTGTSLSRADIAMLARFERIAINLDSLSALDAFGRACPGRAIGLRINPDCGIGYGGSEMLRYSGTAATKFGIYRDRLPAALEIARRHGLAVTRLHFHAGCGYLDRALDQLAAVLAAAQPFIAAVPGLTVLNIGGGLGVPHRAADHPLDLDRWAGVIAQALGGRGLTLAVEPGDFLVKDAGVLLTRVSYVETRKTVEFLGLDAGFNLAMEPAPIRSNTRMSLMRPTMLSTRATPGHRPSRARLRKPVCTASTSTRSGSAPARMRPSCCANAVPRGSRAAISIRAWPICRSATCTGSPPGRRIASIPFAAR